MRAAIPMAIAIAVMTTACGRTDVHGLLQGAAGTNSAAGMTSGAAGTSPGAAGVTGVASINAESRGPGCGKPLPADQPLTVPGTPKGYKHYTVMGTGATLAGAVPMKAGPRTFWVRVPADYDPEKAYRTVYLGQGCGGYQIANTNTYQLYKETMGGTEQAIYVAIDLPEDQANMDCYDNRAGLHSQEWEAFDLFHKVVDDNYCVDNNRVYVVGYSTGAWLANMWGCYFAGAPNPPRRFAPTYHIRAQATFSGGEPTEQPPCGGPVAALWIHDVNDNANPIPGSKAALARVGRTNGCDTTYDDPAVQTPWASPIPPATGGCQQFTGCPVDYPVVFCTTNGYGKTDLAFYLIPIVTRFFAELEAGR